MALKADGVPPVDRGGILLAERDHASDALAPTGIHMSFAGAVATLTGPALEGVSRLLQEELSHDGLGKAVESVLMAALAGVRAHVAVGGLGRRGGLRRSLLGQRGRRKPQREEEKRDADDTEGLT
jgi:hypothetical protein